MVDKKIINKNKIESISIVDKKRCEIFQWKAYSKTFWDEFQEGFYFDVNSKKYFTTLELEIGMFNDIEFIVEDTRVYYKPYVKLRTISGDEEIWKFNNYELALNKGNEILNEFLDKDQALIIERPIFEGIDKPRYCIGGELDD